MNAIFTPVRVLAMVVVGSFGLSMVTASAATLYWWPGTDAAGPGGTGTWDATAGRWSETAVSPKASPLSAPTTSDDVVFGGTGGNISINANGTVLADQISINSTNYVFIAAGTESTRSMTFNSFVINLVNPADIATVAIEGATSTATRGLNLIVTGNTSFAGTIRNGANLGFNLRKSGAGNLTLTGTNTQTGFIQIYEGGIQLGNGGTTGSVTSSQIMSHSTTPVGGANLTLNRSSTLTLNSLIGSSSTSTERNVNVIQSGSGTSVLTANNFYTGTTSVNAGTLLVNGNQSNSTGAVTVAAGATLGGSGTLGGATTVNGIIAPGNSIGTLSINNNVTWNYNTDSEWVFELGSSGASILSPGVSDLLSINGNFLKGSGSGFTFDFAGTGAAGWYQLVSWTGTGASFNDNDFLATNLSGSLSGNFHVETTGLYLEVIPEPSTALLIVLGMGAVFLRRKLA